MGYEESFKRNLGLHWNTDRLILLTPYFIKKYHNQI